MPDEMASYPNFQDFCAIAAKVEVIEDQVNRDLVASSTLPPGFRFHPTDEELVAYYLTKKVENNHCAFDAIDEVNLNKCEPWDLPAKAKVGENAWYFFSLRDRKYPTGMRTNRATDAGYWKATGKDREVMSTKTDKLVGMKKTLVFYTGRAPKGEKTNWIMHEYRIEGELTPVTEWVVCRVFKKNAACKKSPMESNPGYHLDVEDTESFDHQSSTYLPPLLDSPSHAQGVSNASVFTNMGVGASMSSSDRHQMSGGLYHENVRLFNINDFSNVNVNAANLSNWAVRSREIQGVTDNTLENLVSGWDNLQSGTWTWDTTSG